MSPSPASPYLPCIRDLYVHEGGADAVIETYGKNELVLRVFWTLVVAMTGRVSARVIDLVTV
ncbi:MAG: hypothetical protein CVV33_03475 [Methanomicrobiales archaeon HGW-Methanomicrobiales-4]|nr:MAG: hypothetical protein CVV33_03475 [Methanomicrobiales archaeon HGW-Methanomicrobiales-4]